MDKALEKYKKELKKRDELSAKIRNKFFAAFPKLFENMSADYMFDLPEGWIPITFELCEKLSDFGVEVSQVKQKLGGLRVYLDRDVSSTLNEDTQAHVYALIQDAEEKAKKICEWCGSTVGVDILNNGYISRSCDKCRAKILKDNKKWAKK